MTVTKVVTCDVCHKPIAGRYFTVQLTDAQPSEAIVLAARRKPGDVHPDCLKTFGEQLLRASTHR